MTKATNSKAYQTRPKKKTSKHTFPITWLTKDNTIGKCSKAKVYCMKTFDYFTTYGYDDIMPLVGPIAKILWLKPDEPKNKKLRKQEPRKWLIKKLSGIPNSGFGVFSARPFQVGDVISKYIGVTANLNTKVGKKKAKEWEQFSSLHRQYRMILESGNKNLMVAGEPSKDYLFGHFFQHSNSPNCVVDRKTGIISALQNITRNTELTIKYAENMKNWRF